MPAAASEAASSERWLLDGGWTTIVWTDPRLAVRSGIVEGVEEDAAGLAAAGEVDREHRAAAVEDPRGDVRLGMAREARGR